MDKVPSTASPLRAQVPDSFPKLGRFRLFAIFLAALTAAFAAPLWETALFVAQAPYYSHILLIPLITGYLLYQQRSLFTATPSTSLLPTILFAALGMAALSVFILRGSWEHRADYYSWVVCSYLLLALSGAFCLLGWNILRQGLFAIVFLVFAIPLPYPVLMKLQVWLQHASAEAAYWMLWLAGVPMLREGVDFRLPGIPIHVAEECSGFNSSFVLFIVALLAGNLFLRSTKNRLILALAAIPLAILRNGFRITVISMLCVYIGPEMIDSIIHRRGGPLFFALSMIPFVGLIWFLRKRELKSAMDDKKNVN